VLTLALLGFTSWRSGPDHNIAHLPYSQFGRRQPGQGRLSVTACPGRAAPLRRELPPRHSGRPVGRPIGRGREASSGAANDLAGATQMVTEFGLSPDLGPVGYSSGNPDYLGTGLPDQHPYSDKPSASSTGRCPAGSAKRNSGPPSCCASTATSSTAWPHCCGTKKPSTVPPSAEPRHAPLCRELDRTDLFVARNVGPVEFTATAPTSSGPLTPLPRSQNDDH
jgi:hypothetical protein